eukprot:EG_transcript_28134
MLKIGTSSSPNRGGFKNCCRTSLDTLLEAFTHLEWDADDSFFWPKHPFRSSLSTPNVSDPTPAPGWPARIAQAAPRGHCRLGGDGARGVPVGGDTHPHGAGQPHRPVEVAAGPSGDA